MLKFLTAAALFFTLTMPARAQSGPVTLWIITPAKPAATGVAVLDPANNVVHEQTAGSFGQNAGSYGQTAGSYGQTAGSFGQSTGSIGRNAGSAGQTAGTFGNSTDTLTTAMAAANPGSPGLTTAGPGKPLSAAWNSFEAEAQRQFPGLTFTFEQVSEDTLPNRLQSGVAADLIVGKPLPSGWKAFAPQATLVPLGRAAFIAQTEFADSPVQPAVEGEVLQRAPNPEAARAVDFWLLGAGKCPVAQPSTVPARAAIAALESVLQADALGAAADRDLARFDPRAAQAGALGLSPEEPLSVHTCVLDMAANDRFAVLSLRATLQSHSALGAVRAVVSLRTDPQGQWHVLQVSPSLQPAQQRTAFDLLKPYGGARGSTPAQELLGVLQISPLDGDIRTTQPELGWDNRGGATLQVVEWQYGAGRPFLGDAASNLFFVPDTGQHLRTQVRARFANRLGTFRWRLWSMGAGGELVLSPWRSVKTVARRP